MRAIQLGLAATLALILPAGAWAQQGGDTVETGTHIMPSMPKFRPPEPIARKSFDKAVAAMFASADADRDGIVTLAEFNADIDALKDKVIRARFARIDGDRNQQISLAEFGAWQRSLGAVALSETQGRSEATTLVPEQLPLDLSGGREEEVLRHLIEPLSATLIVAANQDYDTGATLAEIAAYEGGKFTAADLNADGWLTFDEVEKLQGGPGGKGGPGGPPPGGMGPGGPPPRP